MLCQLVDEAIRVKAEALVLNGDIFDFFFGWRSYFRSKYSKLLLGLDTLAANGAKVWFVEGNHEYGLDALNQHYKFEVISSEGRVVLGPDGKRVLIAHGDLLSPDLGYRAFRFVMRSQIVNFLAFLFPQRWLDRITLWMASTSRKKDKYRVLEHDRIKAMAAGQLRAQCADVIIFGHFHHPYDDELAGHGRLISVTSWDKPSCIVMSKTGQIIRVHPG